MNLLHKEHRGALAICSAALAIALILFYGLVARFPNPELTILDLSYNVIMYGVAIGGSFVLFMFLCWLLCKARSRGPLGDGVNRILSWAAAAYGVLSIVFLYYVYDNESEMPGGYEYELTFMRERYPHLLFAGVMAVFIVLSFLWLQRSASLGRAYRISASILASLGCAMLNYGPNPFRNDPLGMWHNNAYTNTIIQAAQGVPYDDVVSTIYGHYGLIYLPFVKLFGDNYRAVAITMALFTAVIFLCEFYVADRLIHNDLLYMFVLVASVGTFTTYVHPCQTISCLPHRYLFPAIAVAYICWERCRGRELPVWTRRILDVVLGVLAFTFNTETGIFIMGVLALYRLLTQWDHATGIVGFVRNGIGKCAYGILCMAISYVWVLIHNLMNGGTRNGIHTFFYPLLSDDYEINVENYLPLATPVSPYMLHVFLFLLVAWIGFAWLWMYGKRGTKGFDRASLSTVEVGTAASVGQGTLDDLGRVSVLFTMSLISAADFSYFMDRPAIGNIEISHVPFIIVLAFWVDRYYGHGYNKDTWRKADAARRFHLCMAFTAFVLLAWFAWECIFGLGNTIEHRRKNLWNTTSWEQSIETFKEEVPEGMMCFGLGMPEICYDAGRDPGIHLQDFANWNTDGNSALMRALDEVDTFAVTSDTWFDHSAFEEDRVIETDDFSITIYVRK